MKYLRYCNGCRNKNLIDISIYNLQICKNCLLVSRKTEKTFFSKVEKVFKDNDGYHWNLENIEKRSKINYFFLVKYLNLQR